MSITGRNRAVPVTEGGGEDYPEHVDSPIEPTLEGVFSDDGVDLTLIRWMLRLSPTDRLRSTQSLIDAAWALRSASET